ncbi:ArnT family glycosyltransferase [Gorillibacterium timonense]|uniref:ArnT family glycosyltransferase n=1 Tax=Gorillibacterium timonense TaxID=1689269 RepID=UPI00131B1E06|nr:glycosyltransferase family 39 protein [Gorillibacterium timonense]
MEASRRWNPRLFWGLGALFFGSHMLYTLLDASHDLLVWLLLPAWAAGMGLLWAVLPSLRAMKPLTFWLLLIGCAGGLRLAAILWVDTPPYSDFQIMYDAARSAARGEFSFVRTDYFTRWNYQLGFTLYEAFILKLSGGSLFALRFVQVLLGTGSACVVYGIAKELFGQTAGRVSALLYALYPPMILMGSVLTNQHLSNFLFALGVYFVLRLDKSRQGWWAAGLCLGLGHLIRPLGVFYVTGVVLYGLALLLRSSDPSARKRMAMRVLGMAAVVVLLQQVFSYSLVERNITDGPLASREPYWKLMVGLNAGTTGAWSPEDEEYASSYPLGEQRNEAELNQIKERLSDPAQLSLLLLRKYKVLWGTADSSPYWALSATDKKGAESGAMRVERIFFLIISSLCFLSLLRLWRDRAGAAASGALLLLLLLGGYALVHLFIEVQVRYRLDVLPLYLVFCGYGLVWLREVRPPARKPPA